jgi:hypothetical protein
MADIYHLFFLELPDYFTNNPPPAGQAYYMLDEILPSE